eukprot:3892552-Amphidinium_carterae.1
MSTPSTWRTQESKTPFRSHVSFTMAKRCTARNYPCLVHPTLVKMFGSRMLMFVTLLSLLRVSHDAPDVDFCDTTLHSH